MSIENLPVDDAIANFVERVSFGNPVPHWHDYTGVGRRNTPTKLRRRMGAYLTGNTAPAEPLRIDIPEPGGKRRSWIVPSVFDQIILETVSAALAPGFRAASDDRVLSYRLSDDPAVVYEDLFSSWEQFQVDTLDTLNAADTRVLLKIDLEDAFPSLDRSELFDFVETEGKNPTAVALFRALVEGLDPDGQGLPHVNDSTFLVGSAFLARADEIVGRTGTKFVRYLDDYHLFLPSVGAAEVERDRLTQELAGSGFIVNAGKTSIIPDADDYAATTREAPDGFEVDYAYLSVPIGGPPDPHTQLEYVRTAIEESDERMTKGFGRLTLGFLRQSRRVGDEHHETYRRNAIDNGVVDAALDRLAQFWVKGAAESWRSSWLLYVLADFVGDLDIKRRLESLPSEGADELPLLWRKRLLRRPLNRGLAHNVHEKSYLEEGRVLYD